MNQIVYRPRVARSPGILYGEAQGIIMTNDGTEVETWKGGGIGRMSGAVKVSIRGAIYWIQHQQVNFHLLIIS